MQISFGEKSINHFLCSAAVAKKLGFLDSSQYAYFIEFLTLVKELRSYMEYGNIDHTGLNREVSLTVYIAGPPDTYLMFLIM